MNFIYSFYIKNLNFKFDEKYYKEKYSDLNILNNKNFNYYDHWIKYGKKNLDVVQKNTNMKLIKY